MQQKAAVISVGAGVETYPLDLPVSGAPTLGCTTCEDEATGNAFYAAPIQYKANFIAIVDGPAGSTWSAATGCTRAGPEITCELDTYFSVL